MAFQPYVPPEQLIKDRSDYARKGIARGKSVVAVEYQLSGQAQHVEQIAPGRERLRSLTARADESGTDGSVAPPARPFLPFAPVHVSSASASPGQTTNEEPQPQVRFTFGFCRLKPDDMSSSR